MHKIAFLLAFVACNASAQSVYKCRDAKGTPVYQSEPCANVEKRWDAHVSPSTPADYRARRNADMKVEADRRHMRARARQLSAGGGPVGASVSPQSGSSCEQAKRHRQMVYDAAGLNRSFELSRKMDDMVYDACK